MFSYGEHLDPVPVGSTAGNTGLRFLCSTTHGTSPVARYNGLRGRFTAETRDWAFHTRTYGENGACEPQRCVLGETSHRERQIRVPSWRTPALFPQGPSPANPACAFTQAADIGVRAISVVACATVARATMGVGRSIGGVPDGRCPRPCYAIHGTGHRWRVQATDSPMPVL